MIHQWITIYNIDRSQKSNTQTQQITSSINTQKAKVISGLALIIIRIICTYYYRQEKIPQSSKQMFIRLFSISSQWDDLISISLESIVVNSIAAACSYVTLRCIFAAAISSFFCCVSMNNHRCCNHNKKWGTNMFHVTRPFF